MSRVDLLVVAALFATHLLLHVGLGLGREAPDLAVVAVLAGSRVVAVRWGGVLGFLVGLTEDSLSMTWFGSNTFALTLVGAGGSWSRDVFIGDSVLFTAGFLFLGKWARDALGWLVADAARQPFTEQLLIGSSLDALYAAAVGVAILAMVPVAKATPLGAPRS